MAAIVLLSTWPIAWICLIVWDDGESDVTVMPAVQV